MGCQEGVNVTIFWVGEKKNSSSPSAACHIVVTLRTGIYLFSCSCTKYGKFLPGILFRLLSPCSFGSNELYMRELKGTTSDFQQASPFAIRRFVLLRILFYFCPPAYTSVHMRKTNWSGSPTQCFTASLYSMCVITCQLPPILFLWETTALSYIVVCFCRLIDNRWWNVTVGMKCYKGSMVCSCSWDITVTWVTPKGSRMACSKQQKIWQKIYWTSYKEIYL